MYAMQSTTACSGGVPKASEASSEAAMAPEEAAKQDENLSEIETIGDVVVDQGLFIVEITIQAALQVNKLWKNQMQ